MWTTIIGTIIVLFVTGSLAVTSGAALEAQSCTKYEYIINQFTVGSVVVLIPVATCTQKN